MGSYRIKKVCNIDGCKYIPQHKGLNTEVDKKGDDGLDVFLILIACILLVLTLGLLYVAFYVSVTCFWHAFEKSRYSDTYYEFDTEEEAKKFIEHRKQEVVDYKDNIKKDKLRKKKTTTYINI